MLAVSRRWARLNHILIPARKDERDRYRSSRAGRLVGVLAQAIEAYSREGRSLLLLTLLVGCSSLDARFTQGHQLFAMLMGLLVVSLIARPFFRARGLAVVVQAPDRVAVGAIARFDVCLENTGPEALTSLRIERPFLPWDGSWQDELTGIAVLPGGGRACVPTTATFLARGEHHLDDFTAGALVPLGLAVGPRRPSGGVRFLVVPPVANVVALRLSHRLPDRRGRTVPTYGAGHADIAGVRPYQAGDELRHLHARTWARTGEPHVRTYVDEREDRVALVVLVDGASAGDAVKEAALSLAAGAAARLALHHGGLDALMVNDEWFPVEPRTGGKALDRVLDRLAVHELTRRQCAAEHVLQEELGTVSSLLLVSAGSSPAAQRLVETAAQRGVPLRWAIVTEPGYGHGRVPHDAVVVHAADVEDGAPVVL